MTGRRLLAGSAAGLALCAALAGAGGSIEDPPVEDTDKNLQVLHGFPTSQLIPVMAVMANSLGVTCALCHTDQWESDEKPAKEKARQMLRMTLSANRDFYEGKAVVTCNTCHRGALRPEGTPRIEDAGWIRKAAPSPSPAPPLPSLEDIIERYVSACGGRERLGRLRSRRTEGLVTRDSGRASGSGRFRIEQEKPDIVRSNTDLSYPPEANRWLASLFFLDLDKPERRSRMAVVGRDRIGADETIVVELRGPGPVPHRLEFDARRGDLRRVRDESPTPVGPLPEEYAFGDHRRVGGLRVPHTMEWSRGDYHVVHHVTRIDQTFAP